MSRIKNDMTGWIMAEHGVPDSRLTVLKRVENTKDGKSRWLCECNCAEHNRITVVGYELTRTDGKATKSCGCLQKEAVSKKHFIDMTGWVMSEHGVPDSRLTVLNRADDHIDSRGKHRVQYLCECNCEAHNRIIASGKDLKSGNTKSCGCLAIERLIERSKKENKRDLSGEYGILWTTNTDEEVYFDLEDADKILKYAWHKGTYGYPETHVDGKLITMHKFLGYYYPDHHNRNKLDNRKENLVSCTVQENNRNMPVKSTNTSGFIGVYWKKENKKWVSYINPGDGVKYIGSFINKEDAIRARLQAEATYFKEFAPQRHLFKQYKINVEMEEYK